MTFVYPASCKSWITYWPTVEPAPYTRMVVFEWVGTVGAGNEGGMGRPNWENRT